MNFNGLGVALITPFNDKGKVDYNSIPPIVENIISGGADYLVLMGTTAEVPCLSSGEKKNIIKVVSEINQNRLPMIIGIGGNNTSGVISEIIQTDLSLFGAILSVSPYYNKPSQQGIYSHFSEIAKISPLPVIVYNVPSRTGSSVKPSTFIRLCNDNENIYAIKESSGDLSLAKEIINKSSSEVQVISGDDAMTLPMLLAGGVGTISVLANALPKSIVSLFQHVKNGNLNEAYKFNHSLMDMIRLLFEEGNPVGIKCLMELMGICTKTVRLPLVSASSDLVNKMEEVLNNSIFNISGNQ